VTSGRVFEDPSAGAGNDLNYVSLDREAAKLAANQIRYDVSSTLASAELAQLAYAVSDGKGM
jgi:flagellar basal body rod protein FlgB